MCRTEHQDAPLKAAVLTIARHGQSDPVSYAFATSADASLDRNPDRLAIILIEEFGLNQSMNVMNYIESLRWYTFSPLANATALQGLPFIDLALYEEIQGLVKDAIRRCGCSHDVYISQFSRSVDDLIARKGNKDNTDFILSVARKEDYATPEEIMDMQEESLESGHCIHGIDPDCCPAGCGEY